MTTDKQLRIVELVERVPLFQGLPPKLLSEVARVVVPRRYSPGDEIVEQGEQSGGIYSLVKGRCSVSIRDSALNVERVVAELSAGETFGELSLLTGGHRTATVSALVETDCLELRAGHFHALLERVPQIGISVSRYLSRKLSSIEQTPYTVDPNDMTFEAEVFSMIPEELQEQHSVLPLHLDESALVVLMVNPEDANSVQAIRRSAPGLTLRIYRASEKSFHAYRRVMVSRVRQQGASVGAVDSRYSPKNLNYETAVNPLERKRSGVASVNVTEMMSEFMTRAIITGVSDVHIEPGGERGRIRFRVSGNLHLEREYPMDSHARLISRIKVVGGMNISVRRKAQDGRFGMTIADRTCDVRVNVLPSLWGEKVVMRLLNADNLLTLDKVLLLPRMLAMVREMIFSSMGCILVVGPTGSGKTTTLYSVLGELREISNTLNISTIENPVEYTLDFLTQVAVDTASGLGFADVLRALMRQDPDIIMVGEMRDTVTAQIGLEASMTGHLVLSTLHAKGAPDTITRLVEMDCPPHLVAGAVSLILGQRLVRRLCQSCKEPYQYGASLRTHLERSRILNMESSATLSRERGCAECAGTGWRGRVAILEAMKITPAIREAIISGSSSDRLYELARLEDTIITYGSYSAFLLQQGLTTPNEVLRHFGG